MKRISLVLLFLLVILFFFLFIKVKFIKETKFAQIKIKQAILKVEIVDQFPEMIKGLSGRKSIPEDSGMLFIFKKEDYYGFWMKEMNFPIDIIFFNKDLKVVDYKKNISPQTYPQVFKPSQPAQYVLETKAGFIKKENIELNDSLVFLSD